MLALLTFDYELFLGEYSGTVEKCILEPTRKIAHALRKYNAQAIFFVDCTYLYSLEQEAANNSVAKNDYAQICRQISELSKDGHYIYYHIHPHWIDARYDSTKNQWILPHQEKYCFNNLSNGEQLQVFDNAVGALKCILTSCNNYKKPEGFRAGGLYIQPFDVFESLFKKHDIKYEFSVLQGAEGHGINDRQSFDFKNVTKNVYRFSSDVTTEDSKGPYMELSLNVHTIEGIDKVLNRMFAFLSSRLSDVRMYGDGSPTKNKIQFNTTRFRQGRLVTHEIFSAERLNRYKTHLYLKHIKKTGYLHLLSHPKLMSPASIAEFEHLLSKLSRIKAVSYDFKNHIRT